MSDQPSNPRRHITINVGPQDSDAWFFIMFGVVAITVALCVTRVELAKVAARQQNAVSVEAISKALKP